MPEEIISGLLQQLTAPFVEFISSLFANLNQSQLPYVVLRNYENLPYIVGHDLDLMIEPAFIKRFEQILKKVSLEHGVIQFLQLPRPASCTYVFFKMENLSIHYLKMDVDFRMAVSGIVYLNAPFILKDRIPFNKIFVPRFSDEFMVSFFQKFLGRREIKEKILQRFTFIIEREEAEILQKMKKVTGTKQARQIITLLKSGRISELQRHYLKIKFWVIFRAIFRNPKWLLYLFESAKIFWKRLIHPRGIFLSFIGVDGAGKSTLISHLSNRGQYFLSGDVFTFSFCPHFLPVLGKTPLLKSTNKNADELDVQNRWSNQFFSVIRLLYYSMDFILGYFFKIYPMLVRNGLIIADRYYFDYFVHPERYNIRHLKKLINLIYYFIPKPHITFFINAEPEIILNRKKELSAEKIKEVQENIRRLQPRIRNFIEISTNDTLQNSQFLIERNILNR